MNCRPTILIFALFASWTWAAPVGAQSKTGAGTELPTLADVARMFEVLEQTGRTPASILKRYGKRSDPYAVLHCAWAYEKLGQSKDLLRAVRILKGSKGVFAKWAVEKEAELRGQVQDRPEAVSSYLQRLVRDLDGDKGAQSTAQRHLTELGALAVPAILERLGSFSPVGLRAGLQLTLPHIDDNVVETVRTLIRSKDPIVQNIAASVIYGMRAKDRITLGRLALGCESEEAQLSGVHALLEAGVDTEECVGVLNKLRASNSSTVRKRVAWDLAHPKLRDIAKIDSWLEEWLRSERGTLAETALKSWLERRGKGDRARKMRLFLSLPDWLKERMITRETQLPLADRNHDLLVEGLRFEEVAGSVMRVLQPSLLVQDAKRLSSLLRETNHTTPYTSPAPVPWLLSILVSRPTPGVEGALKGLLSSPVAEIRNNAYRVLVELDPLWILDQHDRFVADNEYHTRLSDLAYRHARPKDMPWLVAAIPSLGMARSFGHRSDATNLPSALALVKLPAVDRNVADAYPLVKMALRRWFGPEHVAPALRQLFSIESRTADYVLQKVREHAGPNEARAVIAAIRVSTSDRGFPAGGMERREGRMRLIAILGGLGAEGAEFLAAQLDDPDVAGLAMDALSSGGSFDKNTVYRRILSDLKPVHRIPTTWIPFPYQTAKKKEFRKSVVDVIFADPFTAANDEVRALALQCLIDWPLEERTSLDFLAMVSAEERRRVATAIVKSRVGLKDSSAMVYDALGILGDFRSEELIPVLALGLQSASETVREAAVSQLGRTLSRKAVPYLIEALGDDYDLARSQAEGFLETIASILEKKRSFTERFQRLDEKGDEAKKVPTSKR